MKQDSIKRSAIFDPTGTWRYELRRSWSDLMPAKGLLCLIGLNPSVADHERDDHTIRVEMGFTKKFGMAGFIKVNLFGLVSTDPMGLKIAPDPVGPENDKYILNAVQLSDLVVAAWGADGILFNRAGVVRRMLGPVKLMCLGTTKSGAPRHPSRLSYDTPLVEFK